MNYEPNKTGYTVLQSIFLLVITTTVLLYCYIEGKLYYGLIIMVSFSLQQICLWKLKRKRIFLEKTILFFTYFFPLLFGLKDNTEFTVPMQVFLFSGIVVIVLYYLINRRSIKILLSKEYIEKYSPPLNKKEFSIECYSLFTIPIAEEFFFRNFLFSLFNKSLISVIFTVLIISFLFVVSHYNSPWAPYLMGKKDLFWLFILSSFLIILKLSFQSIILCILVHYFFNLPTFLNYLSRLKKSKVYK